MRISAIPFFIFLVLVGGCASTSSGRVEESGRVREQAAWSLVVEVSAARCGVEGAAPPMPDKAVETSRCITRLVSEYVLPHAVAPPLLVSSRAAALRLAEKYAAGHISVVDYKRRSVERLRHYQYSLAYFANERLASRTD